MKNYHFLFIFLFGAVFFFTAQAHAATYYTATTGDDANSGTQGSPFGTIKKGLSVMGAGDTLYLRGGTYNEGIDSQNETLPSGTSWSNPITIAANPGETVTLTRGLGINSYNQGTYQYIVMDSLIIDASNVDGAGVFIGGPNTHHIRLQNGEVKNMHSLGPACSLGPAEVCPGGQGVQSYAASFVEFINLKVHDNGVNRLDHGFYVCGNNITIRDSDVYNNSGYGIQIYDGSSPGCSINTQIYNNRIHDNRGDGGVTLNDGDNIQFYNNLVYNNTNGVAISYGKPNNTQIYNNTIYNQQGGGIDVGSGVTNTLIKNNILYQNSSTISDNGTGTTQSNNYTSNPMFMNPPFDFHLQSGSEALTFSDTHGEVGAYGNGGGPGTSGGGSNPTPVPTPSGTACNGYQNGSVIPQGFGIPWDVFNPTSLLLKLYCSTSTKEGWMGPSTYVYHQGYAWDGTKWNAQTFTCTGGGIVSNLWCPTSAQGTLPANTTYYAAYTCNFVNNSWKCGCRDQACTTNYWQLQKVQ